MLGGEFFSIYCYIMPVRTGFLIKSPTLFTLNPSQVCMEDNEIIKTELAAMDQRLTELEEKIDNIDTKLTQVIDAILGNRLTKSGGFMNDIEVIKTKIDVLEKKQARYDDFKKKITWTIGIIVAIGLLIEYLTKVYSNVK